LRKKKVILTGIYRISNILDDKIYIGSAKDIHYRWRQHLNNLKGKKHHSINLQNWVNKYSINYLIFEIIELCKPIKVELLALEQKYLDEYNPYFNTCKIAGNSLGVKHTLKTRNNMSKAHNKIGIYGIPEWSVNQYELDGKFIKTWDSANHAKRELSIDAGGIYSCILGKSLTYKDYQWKKYEGVTSDIDEYKRGKSSKRKIQQLDMEYNFIKDFDSVMDIQRELGLNNANIIKVCQNKAKSCGGYKFKYYEQTNKTNATTN